MQQRMQREHVPPGPSSILVSTPLSEVTQTPPFAQKWQRMGHPDWR